MKFGRENILTGILFKDFKTKAKSYELFLIHCASRANLITWFNVIKHLELFHFVGKQVKDNGQL